MKKHLFVGTGTALITPFKQSGEIDFDALAVLVEQQIAGGVDFLVPCGTTGESPTMTHPEHEEVMEFVVSRTSQRKPVLAGAGSNSTAEALALTETAKAIGADGVLVVAPYYNKPTQAGMKDYYRAIAKIGLPVILYDIPGRCGGQGVTAETILELAHEGTIRGLKWASGNLDQLQDVLVGRPEGFTVLSGDDNLTFTAMCLGAEGAISVLANLMPQEVAKLVVAMHTHHHDFARKLHYRLLPLMRAMFIETNPIPLKTALAMVHQPLFQEVFRSPLVKMGKENKRKLAKVLLGYFPGVSLRPHHAVNRKKPGRVVRENILT